MCKGITVMLVCFIAALVAGPVQADVIKQITSGDFSIGYGYNAAPGYYTWNTTETTGSNLIPTGDFTFSPNPTSTPFGSAGPTFTGRGIGGSSSVSNGSAMASAFDLPVTARYTGAAPGDASATPNYQLTLQIDNLKIWGGDYTGELIGWNEYTSGHESAQTPFAMNGLGGYNNPANYSDHVVWNPVDYAVTLPALGSSITRSFNFKPYIGPADDLRYIDGLEVYGKVILTYNAIPEPSTVVLLATGLIGLLAYAWKKRR